jgi:two-component system cell cycle sensor histidine kinase/response regulator CckA
VTRPTDSELYPLFDRSPIGMYRSTRDGRFLYWNAALCRITGYSDEEMANVNIVRDLYLDPEERERLVTKFGPLGMIDGATVKWKHKDGRILTIRLFGHIVEVDGGLSFDASVMDITAGSQQREELERTAAILDVVVNQVPAIWWIVDHEMRIQRVGGPTEEILGFPPETFVGQTIRQASDGDPTARSPDRSIEAHQQALNGEIARYSSDYRNRLIENTIAPFRVDGQIVAAIGTLTDVTATRTMERRMVDAQRAESLGVLAGGLAHDFNNLLVAILGNADLALRDVSPGAPGRAALENIRNASLRAAELTDQLLAYAGRGSVSPQRVVPKPLVDELLRISSPQLRTNVQIEVDIPDALALRGDEAQVRQVMMNLIANARDAVGEKGGNIRITAKQLVLDGSTDVDDIVTPSAGAYVSLDVTDDGPGMGRETRRRIFDPFFTTKPTGHGLGIAAVLGIIRAHGGGLRVHSAHGQGCTFQVIWPASTTAPSVPAVKPMPKSVLVVDDEDLVRDVVVRMIADLGYSPIPAADGFAALELAKSQEIDAALVDLTMPRMSGAELVAQLRTQFPAIKVVLCTGYDRDRKGPVSADAYLPKPFRMDALERILAKVLGINAL